MNSKRLAGLDLYRMIACAFVIINHCNSKVLLQVTPKSLAWYVTVGVIFITKICVPGFFMITGYNLLHRREDVKTWFGRILRIVVVLAVFSLFYYVWRCLIHTMPVTIPEGAGAGRAAAAYILGYLRTLWHGGATDAFWYLYTYLGLLIVMPVLQILASYTDKLKPKHLLMLLGAAAVYVSLVPTVSVLWPDAALCPDLDIPMVCTGVLYLFTGHVMYRFRNELGAGEGIKARDLGFAAVFAGAFLVNMVLALAEFAHTDGQSAVTFSDIHMTGMLVESVAAFVIFLKMRPGQAACRIIEAVSPAAFGIYLFADFMCSNTHMIYYYLCQYMNRLAAVAVQEIAAYAIALTVVVLIRFIPVVRKYV